MTLTDIVAGGLRVLPVLTCDDPDVLRASLDEIGLAGIVAVEVTLRTPHALDVIKACSGHGTVAVGAGTVLSREQLDESREAGAAFAVSPGYDPELVAGADDLELPYLPGVATSSEVLRAYRNGVREVKFFPAGVSGGPGFCAAMTEVYPAMRFVPTGGIAIEDTAAYLQLPNVTACGGSWLTRPLAESHTALTGVLRDIRAALN